ncbi:MAG: hypothetical protein B7Z22_07695 [Hyphomonas sp. 32-62-5]|nr:MAG: hypothetical protein B7Z22_07695 [Hyphomonas sp. 32-62-5]
MGLHGMARAQHPPHHLAGQGVGNRGGVLGNFLGQNDGRVVQVAPDRVELVELVSDGGGGWVERQATLSLEDI